VQRIGQTPGRGISRPQEDTMPFRLIPRDETFYSLFDQAAANVAECAGELRDLLGALSEASTRLDRITAIERRNDEVTRQLLRRLNQSFVTPFDREDIHALTEELDDAVDDVLAAAELLVLHHVGDVPTETVELADTLVKAAEATVSLVSKLPRLRDMESDHEAIDQLESQADRAYRKSVARLFSGQFDALTVLKIKDVVEAIESSVNRLENISDIVESIQLKHA
jgi:uncharacterized protein